MIERPALVKISLFARWRLTAPALELGLAPQAPAGSNEFSGPARSSRLAWQLGGSADTLSLEVDAADGTPESLLEALSLYHYLAEAVANQIPAENVLRSVSGPRLQLPVEQLSDGDLHRWVGLAAPVISPWLSRTAAGNA